MSFSLGLRCAEAVIMQAAVSRQIEISFFIIFFEWFVLAKIQRFLHTNLIRRNLL